MDTSFFLDDFRWWPHTHHRAFNHANLRLEILGASLQDGRMIQCLGTELRRSLKFFLVHLLNVWCIVIYNMKCIIVLLGPLFMCFSFLRDDLVLSIFYITSNCTDPRQVQRTSGWCSEELCVQRQGTTSNHAQKTARKTGPSPSETK